MFFQSIRVGGLKLFLNRPAKAGILALSILFLKLL